MARKRPDSIEEYQAKQRAKTEKALGSLVAKTGTVVSPGTLRKDFVKRWRAEEKALAPLVRCIINMGNILIEANPKTQGPKSLPHGEFEAMVRDDLKMHPATARKLMLIAEHPVISNRAHVHDLPPFWGTLYELTKVPTPRLEAKLKDGTIHPAMERADVKPLLPVTRKKKVQFEAEDDPEEEETTSASSERGVEPSTDEEERWRNAIECLCGDIIAAAPSWNKMFPEWKKFECPSHIKELVKEAATALASIASMVA